ncbi:glycosyltransferase family 4 protein [Arthrobacter sp. Sr33]
MADNYTPRSSDYLIIANAYPSDKALYRNAFIHSRLKAYQAQGETVQVFYLHPPVKSAYEYQYDGVDVRVGARSHLEDYLKLKKFKKILIHFASPDMIEPIRNNCPKTPVIVWIHGFEAEAWHRRWFNFIGSSAEIKSAIKKKTEYYDGQLSFMAWLYQTKELDLTFVHVSKWFKENIVEPDAGVPTQNSYVIPNAIDDQLFSYQEKPLWQRQNIISIRPYASRKYANDLMVQAIILLTPRPFFEQLRFSIYGEGQYFWETVEPLKAMKNVRITNGFLRQSDIAKLHKDHGVFLGPTRFDSQGVSMCEAMSSGVVPISNHVSAIPEFVEHGVTGFLAEPENAEGLAEWIERLYFNPELFRSVSSAAAQSIRSVCSVSESISKELEIVRK